MGKYDCEGCKHRTNHTDEGFKFCSGCDRSYLGADSGYHADRYEKEEAEMSMTESERYIEIIKSLDCENITSIVCEYNKTGCSDCSFMIAKNKAIQALEEIQQYRAIGTVSEFRELKEKATAKKPRFYAHNYHCTECGNLVGNNEFHWQRFEYCDKCGQKLDWSEGKELYHG